MRRFASLAALKAAVGESLGTSEWVEVPQERIDGFAEVTNDHQWIHVDPERAGKSPLGSTIAHGYLTLSLLGPAALEVWIRPAAIPTVLNYGIDRVRFIAPVPSGSRVRNRVKLLAMEPKGEGKLLITTENTLEIEGQAKPALVANTLVMAVA